MTFLTSNLSSLFSFSQAEEKILCLVKTINKLKKFQMRMIADIKRISNAGSSANKSFLGKSLLNCLANPRFRILTK